MFFEMQLDAVSIVAMYEEHVAEIEIDEAEIAAFLQILPNVRQ